MRWKQLHEDYLNNKCAEVWKEITFLDYNSLDKNEASIVLEIIKETLKRIESNLRMIHAVLKKYNFHFHDFRGNDIAEPIYLKENFEQNLDAFYKDKKSPQFVPLFLASFSSYFKVVDFRGDFRHFERSLLLDHLSIDCFDHQEAEGNEFSIRVNGQLVDGYMFSADQFLKEDVSGDLGPCITLSEKLLIDNYVVNYDDDEQITFVEYLRFCVEWGCFPNLCYASEEEIEPFLGYLDEVRQKLQPF